VKIFPAIDILDGKAVRLYQGCLDSVKVYNDDPVDQARKWAEQGAEWIHVVDLDGAVLGEPKNADIVAAIVKSVNVSVQVGGGIRSLAVIDHMFGVGASRVVLGTALVSDPELVSVACAKYPGIVAGIDARDGRVAIEGWKQGTERGVLELINELELLGVRRVAYTDISRDGTRAGVNYGAYRALVDRVELPVIASGGVAGLDDIRDLASIGPQIEGVIIGSALYEEAFTLQQAIVTGRSASEM